jgi:hypothetical protein
MSLEFRTNSGKAEGSVVSQETCPSLRFTGLPSRVRHVDRSFHSFVTLVFLPRSASQQKQLQLLMQRERQKSEEECAQLDFLSALGIAA